MVRCMWTWMLKCFIDHMLTSVLSLTIICSHVYLLRWSHAFMFTCFDIHMLWWSYAPMSTCFNKNMSTCLYALMLIYSDTFMIECSYVNMLCWPHAFNFTCPIASYVYMLWQEHVDLPICLNAYIFRHFYDWMLLC